MGQVVAAAEQAEAKGGPVELSVQRAGGETRVSLNLEKLAKGEGQQAPSCARWPRPRQSTPKKTPGP